MTKRCNPGGIHGLSRKRKVSRHDCFFVVVIFEEDASSAGTSVEEWQCNRNFERLRFSSPLRKRDDAGAVIISDAASSGEEHTYVLVLLFRCGPTVPVNKNALIDTCI